MLKISNNMKDLNDANTQQLTEISTNISNSLKFIATVIEENTELKRELLQLKEEKMNNQLYSSYILLCNQKIFYKNQL